jgi:1-acyl-sn-glycerol-3-phosphate acyltransferase
LGAGGSFLRKARLAVGVLGLFLWLLPGFFMLLLGMRGVAVAIWCRIGLWGIGAKLEVRGEVPSGGALVAANHASYVDIFALGAAAPGVFVAKSEISRWPLIGWVGALAGMIFIERKNPKASARSLEAVRKRLDAGDRVLLFPEGGIKSTRGEVTRFHSMFFDDAALGGHRVTPAAIRYLRPSDPSAWLWIEGETPYSHLFNNLLPAEPIKVAVVFGEPIEGGAGRDRKTVAEAAEKAVGKLWIDAERHE